ncbi:MAG: zinc carboxypeptidase, partial [Thermoactinospora sp.]|nr:zinc carboxypeptidase [Thermoactinospora sp.]
MKRRLVILLAVLSMVSLTGMTGAGAGAEPPANKQYRVSGPANAQQRSAVAATGAAIEEVKADSVLVTATEAEIAAIRRLGFGVAESPRPKPPSAVAAFDFPPADSGYHNFAEMTAEINSLVAAHPTIMSQTTFGTSYEGR